MLAASAIALRRARPVTKRFVHRTAPFSLLHCEPPAPASASALFSPACATSTVGTGRGTQRTVGRRSPICDASRRRFSARAPRREETPWASGVVAALVAGAVSWGTNWWLCRKDDERRRQLAKRNVQQAVEDVATHLRAVVTLEERARAEFQQLRLLSSRQHLSAALARMKDAEERMKAGAAQCGTAGLDVTTLEEEVWANVTTTWAAQHGIAGDVGHAPLSTDPAAHAHAHPSSIMSCLQHRLRVCAQLLEDAERAEGGWRAHTM